MKLKLVLVTAALICASSQAALADRIDGTWCSPEGKSVSIDGPNVVTSRGNAVDANYNRHHIDYAIPAGEPDGLLPEPSASLRRWARIGSEPIAVIPPP